IASSDVLMVTDSFDRPGCVFTRVCFVRLVPCSMCGCVAILGAPLLDRCGAARFCRLRYSGVCRWPADRIGLVLTDRSRSAASTRRPGDPSIVVLAPGEPGVPVTCCAEAGVDTRTAKLSWT